MSLTVSRSALIAGAAAAVLYAGSFGHQWASDDVTIIQNNQAAHSPSAALDAWFEPYWPVALTQSGQYRPLTILSFAADWKMAGDRPGVFHVVNALWHALATGLLVFVFAPWLGTLGALVAGLVFAVHPVHVEAVANIVGRAELMVTAGLFTMVLLARRYRTAETRRWRYLGGLGVVLAASLFAKEHAVVAVAALALDEWVERGRLDRRSAPLYTAVITVTLAWLVLFRAIAGEYVDVATAATIRDLDLVGRLATVFPAYLDVVRLLVWPFNLAADYNPLVILRRPEWSWMATLGLVTSLAIVSLGLVARRAAPAVAFGMLLAVISYAPTSNLLFPSGIMLAERNLYLAAIAPAVVVAWLVMRFGKDLRVTGVAVAVILLVLAVRTASRVPFWRDGETVLIEDFAEHPENYRNNLRVGGLLRRMGNLPAGLAQTLVAGEIFPDDPWVVQYSLVRALDLGRPRLALREALRAYAHDSTHPSFARFVVRARLAQGRPDLALPIARRSIVDAPSSRLAAESYVQVLDAVGAAPWRRELAQARVHWIQHELMAASAILARMRTDTNPPSPAPGACWDFAVNREWRVRLSPRVEDPPECG